MLTVVVSSILPDQWTRIYHNVAPSSTFNAELHIASKLPFALLIARAYDKICNMLHSLAGPMSDYNLINFDILCAVIQFVAYDEDAGISTIAAISRTCKRMRFEASKYLLSGSVKLFRTEEICSFCRFMLADKSSRLPLLKALMLCLDSIKEKEHAGLVCEMLRGLSNLYELDVTVNATSPPWAVHSMATAIASLNSLRILSLSEIGKLRSLDGDQAFQTTLRHSRSPLISLSISLPFYEAARGAGVSYSRKRDPIFLCSCLRSTLERLQIGGDFCLIVRPGHMYEYPRLKKLVLPMYGLSVPYLKPFLVSAPNLRDLQFGGVDNFHARHPHDEDILQARIVTRSRTPQEWRTHNQRDQEATVKSWLVPLDSFKGSIIDAYATGLSCPVTRVHLLSTGGRRKLELAMLSIVLSDWRPSFLRLATKVYRARGYIPILPSASSGWAEALDTLELRLNIVDDRFNLEECFVSDLHQFTIKWIQILTHGARHRTISQRRYPLCPQLPFSSNSAV